MPEHVGLHESVDALSSETVERHRALVSLMEELEAIDWYAQRVDACRVPELAAVLAHNRDEEYEHAAMTLEWLRRNDPKWNEVLRTYLFTEDPIIEVEEHAEATDGSDRAGEKSLGIGTLHKEPAR